MPAPHSPPPDWSTRDTGWCLRTNRWCERGPVFALFACISRLGDGVFWYLLMAALIVADGWTGLHASVHMAATGVVALTLYRSLKRHTRRPRPFAADARIRAWIAPLDEYSFPSGHTLHAVAFSSVAVWHYPVLAWLLVSFASAVAASRVVLGLHYPSDVLAALAIGGWLAALSIICGPALVALIVS